MDNRRPGDGIAIRVGSAEGDCYSVWGGVVTESEWSFARDALSTLLSVWRVAVAALPEGGHLQTRITKALDEAKVRQTQVDIEVLLNEQED